MEGNYQTKLVRLNQAGKITPEGMRGHVLHIDVLP
jgi:hypothetical protein